MVTDRALPSDFIVHGVVCPPRICRLVAPFLVRSLDEALRAQHSLDPELVLWIRAVDLEGRRWATGVDASESDDSSSDSSHSTQHEPLTTDDVATELGCTPNNVRDLARRGRIAATRRRPYLFDRAEVDRFKSQRRKSA